jgi:hypothetical protein
MTAKTFGSIAVAIVLGALVAITEIHRHIAAFIWSLMVFIFEQ